MIAIKSTTKGAETAKAVTVTVTKTVTNTMTVTVAVTTDQTVFNQGEWHKIHSRHYQ